MMAVNSAFAEADADVVEGGDGGVAAAVELADALGPGRGGGRDAAGGAGDDGHVFSCRCGRRPVRRLSTSTLDHAGRAPIGLGARLAGRWPRGSCGRSCGQPHPRGSGQRPPATGREGADCTNDPAAAAAPALSARVARRRAGARRARRRSWCWCTSSLVLGGGALIGHTASPDVALSVLATAVVALAFEPGADAARGARVAGRCTAASASPYDVLSRFSRDGDRQLRRRGAARRGWPRCWPTAPARSGRRSGWWSATGPRCAATWPPGADARAARTPADGRARPGRRSLPVRHGGELLGVLVVQERAHRPLTSVEERLFAGLADQAGLVLRGARLRAELEPRGCASCPRAPTSCAARGSGWSTPRTPSAGCSSATSTTAPSSTWSRSP